MIRRIDIVVMGAALSIGLGACVAGRQGPLPDSLAKEHIRELQRSVFEVVIPKGEEKLTYAKPLPLDRIPYAQRIDAYYGIGTAFAITGRRLVSAAHVFDLHQAHPERIYYVRDADGKVHEVDQILKYSDHRDLVVFTLKTYPKGLKKLALSRRAEVGDRIYTVGNAQGEGISIRDGQIASFTAEPVAGAWQEIRYSAPASPGNSGGPLLNTNGETVGVVIRKNSSENLNFAVPIAEIHRVSEKRAHFEVRENRSAKFGLERDTPWTYKPRLPANVGSLARKAERRYRRFWMAEWKALMAAAKAKRYPQDRALVPFLFTQKYSTNLRRVVRGGAGYEALDLPRSPLIGTSSGAAVSWSRISAVSDFVYVQRQDGKDPTTLWRDQQRVLDAVIEAQAWTRDVGGSPVPITSFGKPSEASVFVDDLDRPWSAAIWRTSYDSRSTFLNCLPEPRGVACLLYRVPTEQETRGFQEQFAAYHAAEIVLSYKGNPEEWRRFLALPAKSLPKVFKGARLGATEQGFEFALAGLGAKFRPRIRLAATEITVGLGYDPADPRRQSVQSLRILDGSRPAAAGEEFVVLHIPRGGAKAAEGLAQNLWKAVSAVSGGTDVRIVDENGKSLEGPEAFVSRDKLLIVSCQDLGEGRESLLRHCDQVAAGARLGVLAH